MAIAPTNAPVIAPVRAPRPPSTSAPIPAPMAAPRRAFRTGLASATIAKTEAKVAASSRTLRKDPICCAKPLPEIVPVEPIAAGMGVPDLCITSSLFTPDRFPQPNKQRYSQEAACSLPNGRNQVFLSGHLCGLAGIDTKTGESRPSMPLRPRHRQTRNPTANRTLISHRSRA